MKTELSFLSDKQPNNGSQIFKKLSILYAFHPLTFSWNKRCVNVERFIT
jgi:hypothetical protein